MHRFHTRYNPASNRLDLFVVDRHDSGKLSAVLATYEAIDEVQEIAPTLSVEPEAVQQLAEQLWAAGVRPAAALQEIEKASQHAGGSYAPWLMAQLSKFIDQATKKESPNEQGQG